MQPIIIAEIGCNHKGDIEVAKKMIYQAITSCRVDVVKFQKRTPQMLLTTEEYNAMYNSVHAYGRTYGEHREFLEFNVEQHRELKEIIENLGAIYSSSVWDLNAAKEIISLKPRYIKVPSPCNNNRELLLYIANNFSGEIHVSLGMTTLAEERALVELFEKTKRLRDVVLYVCTSAYPARWKDLCLLEIKRLQKVYGNQINGIGFSGHHIGILPDVVAYTLGCKWIERHFTLNQAWKGTDHIMSLKPDELKDLTIKLRALQEVFRYKHGGVLEIEHPQREKLKWKECIEM